MTEPQKTSHWLSLAETLGAQIPEPTADAPPPTVPAPPPLPTATLPAKKERPKPAPRKGDWGLVASFLGIAPPPEPAPPPAPPPVVPPPVAARPDVELERREPREPRRSERYPEREPSREEPRAASSRVREWDAPDEPSAVEDELLLGADNVDDEIEIEIEMIDGADEREPSPEEGEQRAEAEGERRPRRRRRRRGRRTGRGEPGETRESVREPRAERPSESAGGDEVEDRQRAPASDGERPAASDEDRPRRKKRRRGRRSSSGRERPPPRRPAPDESARDEEAAFISESGGDELDADFGPDEEGFRGEASSEIAAERVTPGPDVHVDDDEHEDADDSDGEAEHAGKKHKIPSWQETVGILVDANLASRGKSSGHPQRGGRGRGRGRGR